MSETHVETRASVLSPVERVSEIIFGLLMALAITGSLSVASAGGEEVRTMMFAALGCNIAWGLVDGIMYLVQTLTERTRAMTLAARIRSATDTAAARALIAEVLPGHLGAGLSPQALEALRLEVVAVPESKLVPGLKREDYAAAFGVFLLVVLSTLPVVLPFMFVDTLPLAMRLSQLVALATLFVGGWMLGRYSGGSPWKGGCAMAMIGAALAAAIVALGG